MKLEVNYDLLKSWKSIILTTLLFELFFQAIVYLHPENIDWINSEDFSISNLLQFLFIDQFLIECISIAFIFLLLRNYAIRLKLFHVQLSMKELLLYELKFLPVLLLCFFIFAPFTLTARYLYHYFPNLNSEIYFQDYFYSVSLYVAYLFPVLIIGYIIININLIKFYNRKLNLTAQSLDKVNQDFKKEKVRVNSFKKRIKVFDDFGELLIEVEKIKWIERIDRKTFMFTNSDKYRVKGTISEMEKILDGNDFVQINRSVIINLNEMLNYSFWENDKYIVRMKKTDQEFVMSRKRLNKLKDKLL